jgi:hypothetical protein
MRGLACDHRGYPIPWGVFVDKAGRPHFQINDDVLRYKALKGGLCPICGYPLLRGRWFVGGPMSAFHENGAFADPPMHHECMQYAMRVCPYLAAPRYGGRIDDRTLGADRPALLADYTQIERRPDLFVAALATGQKLCGLTFSPNVIPRRPYLRVEYWSHGVQLTADEGEAMVEADKPNWPALAEATSPPKIVRGPMHGKGKP